MMSLFVRICITLARLALGFWVGGAILFVITSVAEQKSPMFDSVARDQLATVRFPHYYRFAAICLGSAVVSIALCLICGSGRSRIRLASAGVLVLLASAIAVVDYAWVYRPLQALIVPPGQVRTQAFQALHEQSQLINEVHLSITLLAAVILCFPFPQVSSGNDSVSTG